MHNRRRGFTLVEMLVVITIITILAGLILPALGRARRAAHIVACVGNLKAIGTALATYQNEGGARAFFYPYWLSSMAVDDTVNQQLLICPLDANDPPGSVGARPADGGTDNPRNQYHETDDFGFADSESGGVGAEGRKTRQLTSGTGGDFGLVAADPNDESQPLIKRCSYLYEWTREACSWSSGKTWYEAKRDEAALSGKACGCEPYNPDHEGAEIDDCTNQVPTSNRVPMVRCYWHLERNGERKGTTNYFEYDESEIEVQNLRINYDVSASSARRWFISQ